MRPARPVWVRPLLCSTASTGVGLAVFAAGRSSLPLPGGWTESELARWWADTGWLVAVFAVARVLLLVAAGIMAIGSLVAAAAVPARAAGCRVGWLGGAVRLPGGALLMRAALGVTASGLVVGACGPGSPVTPGAPAPAGSAPVAGPEAAPILRNTAVPTQSITKRSRALPPSGRGGAARGARPFSAARSRAAPAAGAASRGPGGGAWRVRPGDSLWSIAEANTRSAEQVSAYWVRLMALNRSRLPVPGDPSLLFPGDIVLLPPLQEGGP